MICKKCGGEIRRGECKLCEMFATGATPCIVTDDTRFQGFTKVGGAQFKSDAVRNYYLNEAKKAGVDVTGKEYFPQLADFPGDPRAWCDSQGEMRRVLEERGWSCDGDLKVKGREVAPAPAAPIADDIVDGLVEDRLETEFGPDFEKVPVKRFNEIKEEVVEKHSAPAHYAKAIPS